MMLLSYFFPRRIMNQSKSRTIITTMAPMVTLFIGAILLRRYRKNRTPYIPRPEEMQGTGKWFDAISLSRATPAQPGELVPNVMEVDDEITADDLHAFHIAEQGLTNPSFLLPSTLLSESQSASVVLLTAPSESGK